VKGEREKREGAEGRKEELTRFQESSYPFFALQPSQRTREEEKEKRKKGAYSLSSSPVSSPSNRLGLF